MSIGPARRYGLIIPKGSYITSPVRQGIISREAKKRLKWMVPTKRIIFNKIIFISFEQDNTTDCAECRIYTSKMAV